MAPVVAETPEWQNFEPVRAISPGPRSRTQIIQAPQTVPVPTATPTPGAEIASEADTEERPTPSLPPVTESPSSPYPKAKLPPVTVPEMESYSPETGKIVGLGMDLTMQKLAYKYASADPAKGGLDCSGFIYYVLTKSGVKNVPRDAREQYIWIRKAGNFQAVLAHSDDTFELDSLKPGDLLFWANNFGVSRDPEITQTMIYIGRDKSTKQRLMIGASEGGTFKGEKKSGVGVFDFQLRTAESKPEEESTSVFVGYGRVPSTPGD
jgi:cell wall-associated NlpC family hydrolase